MSLTTKLTQIIETQYDRLILTSIVFFAFGSCLAILVFDNLKNLEIALSISCFLFLIFLAITNKQTYKGLFFTALAIFFFGFLSSFLYQKIYNYTKITGKIFVNVEGIVADYTKFVNKKTRRDGLYITLHKLELSQAEFENKQRKKEKKAKKINEKNLINSQDFIDIDLQYFNESKNYQDVNWVQEGTKMLYPQPPQKITVISHHTEKIAIGDKIFFKATILPPQKKEFVGGFDFELNSLSKNIGGSGYVSGDIKILERKNTSSFDEFFEELRKKIKAKILKTNLQDEGGIAVALLIGDYKGISEETMKLIRNSGLAHLISISGLHLSLAAGIFFFTARFLLSQSNYLTLNFDIKKISAILAIFSSYFYLKIAGSPIPAIRAFIAILLIMLAILFDKKTDSLRLTIFAAFVIIFLNPYNIFSISFQLSFAAILALISFHEIWSNSQFKSVSQNKIAKFFNYFFELIFISIFTQIATAPFLLYHFGNVSIYGILANIIAIPLTSFLTMPLGFMALFAMPLGLEKLLLLAMEETITMIIKTADFVSNLKYSYFTMPQLSRFGLFLAIFGGLIFTFLKGKIKWFGLFIFMLSFATIKFTKQPDILIDGDARFFAFYDKKNGLVFSKKMKEDSQKMKLWLQKMNEKTFKTFVDKNFCNKEFCEIDLEKYFTDKKFHDKKLFVLLARTKVSSPCGKKFSVAINLTKKYSLPKCLESKVKIDNMDLLEKGVHFIYFENDKIKIKTAN